jgi:hypothetical protein
MVKFIKVINNIKHIMEKLQFLKSLFSPFKPFSLKLYIGKMRIGTPYFYPRKWIKNKEKPGYLKAIPKKVGFDFIGLGYKTKWSNTDYIFEWSPLLSFVFFGYQLAIMVKVDEPDFYWTAWLYYENDTNKKLSKEDRLRDCIKNFPLIYTTYGEGGSTNYYKLILRKRYLKYI